MRKKVFGIKSKLLGVLIPVVGIMITVIIFNIYQSTSNIVIRKSESLLKVNTQSVVNSVKAWMNETLTALKTEREAIEFFSPDEEEELAYIKHTADQYDSFPAGLYLATTDGSLIHASFVPGPEFNVFEKPWYQDGINSEDFIFGSVYFDEDSQSYVVGASGVLKDSKGSVRGVAAADIYLNAISEIVSQVQLEQTGAMFLVDTNTNMIIGHKDASMVGTLLEEQQDGMYTYVNNLLVNQTFGQQIYNAADGNDIYLQMEQVPDSKWITVAYVPHDEIVSDLNALTRKIAIISICGILLLILLMERFIHVIIKPVKKLNLVVGAMSDGDFTTDIQVRTRDEIGVMADGVHRFILVMRDIISQISEVTSILNDQSVNSTRVAGSLSEASGLQSNAMNEMNTTVEELTRSIMEVAENASSLSLLVNDTRETGTSAGNQMEKAVEASTLGQEEMGSLLSTMNDISQKISHLEQSSIKMENAIRQVNSMVDFIQDIAEETNLLSLNASIEAARAGEAGRGFAIVANQIGSLAQNSKNAVNDISELTTEISKLVGQTVSETKDSVLAIQTGSDIVAQTEISFRSIFGAINHTNTAVRTMIEKVEEVNMIAASLAGITQEQSASSEEILASVENMRENAEGVAQNSRTVASDAENLEENAVRLKGQISRFKINEGAADKS